jgi:ABC transporter substrate binding protein
VKGQGVAAFGCPHPCRSLTGEGDLLAAEACLVANHGSDAALALQAVTHGDARWFALNRKAKLSAVAGGVSGRHGPAPWLSILAECRLDFKLEGSLMSYGPDTADIFRRAGAYIGRILRGEKAADLPVQSPTKFELVVNMIAAKALGLTVRDSFLLLADEMIE